MENQQDIEALRQKRREAFARNGIPQPTFSQEQTQQLSNNMPTGGGGGGVRDRIAAIKSGAMKGVMQELNNSKNKQSFEALPVPKPKGQRNQKPVADMPEPQGLSNTQGSKESREAASIEAMFTDSPAPVSDVVMGNAWNQRRGEAISNQPLINPDLEMAMPTPNIESQFKQKLANAEKNESVSPGFDKFYGGSQPSNIDSIVEERANAIIASKMNEIIEKISGNNNKPSLKKGQMICEKVQSSEGKYYKGVIKLGDKYYKLQEVKLKK